MLILILIFLSMVHEYAYFLWIHLENGLLDDLEIQGCPYLLTQSTDIDKIDGPITTDITTRSQPANAWGGNAVRRK